jgi:hypothetical protein
MKGTNNETPEFEILANTHTSGVNKVGDDGHHAKIDSK